MQSKERGRSMKRLVLLWLGFMLLVSTVSPARTWYIKPDGMGDAPTIQAGIDSASAGDTVEVACGIYHEYDIVVKSGITLRSETGLPECVTVDADSLGRVFACQDIDSTTSITGFTIKRGNVVATGTSRCRGGGMFCYRAPIEVRHCLFIRNYTGTSSAQGAGLFVRDCVPRFIDCVFRDNCSVDSWGSAGAAFLWDAPAYFENVEFSGNHAGTYPSQGGAVFCLSSAPEFRNCTFSGNIADYGSCIYVLNTPQPTLDNCILAFNLGGAPMDTALTATLPTLTCCDVYGNEGGDWVGPIAGQCGINGNFYADPLLCDTEYRNYYLTEGSPCSEGQQPICGQVGAYGVGCGVCRVLRVPSPYPTIQAAIDAADSCDTVLVAPGTYIGPGNRDIDFTGKPIVVRSEDGPATCIIDCQGADPVTHRGFYFHSQETRDCKLEEFTITNGYVENGNGGGILCTDYSSPTIVECAFTNNTCERGGGGVYSGGGCSPIIRDCDFSGNVAYDSDSPSSAHGGAAIQCAGGNPVIDSCRIWGNTAIGGRGGGGISAVIANPLISNSEIWGNASEPSDYDGGGGGIHLSRSSGTISDCRIWDNTTTKHGGGLVCDTTFSPADQPLIFGTVIYGNSADSLGGGMYCAASPARVDSCTISDNWAGVEGGGVACWNSSHTVFDNTIISFSTRGRAVFCQDSDPVLNCCDVYGNAGGDWEGCIYGDGSEPGNICEDPLFCNRGAGDYTLDCLSPCLEYVSTCGRIGAHGWACGTARVDGTVSSLSSFSLVTQPNPSRGGVSISFEQPQGGPGELRIIDVTGRLIRRIQLTSRSGQVVWDGGNERGEAEASGVYFVRLETRDRVLTKKVVLVR